MTQRKRNHQKKMSTTRMKTIIVITTVTMNHLENDETNDNDSNNVPDNNSNNEDPSNNVGSSNEDEEPSDRVELPEDIEIDERVQHPNGVIFTLEKISFSEDNITVDFHAHNGHGNYVYFADNPGVTLEDDTGFDYPYMPKSYSEDW